jgi:hypothetical protein
VKQVGVGREKVEHLRKAAGGEAVVAGLMPEPSSRWMDSAKPCAASISFATLSDFSRYVGVCVAFDVSGAWNSP